MLSGLDYPIKPLSGFKTFFKDNDGCEFMQWHRFPYENWEEGTFRRLDLFRLNDYISYRTEKGRKLIDRFNSWQIRHRVMRGIPRHYPLLYGGSNWMSLTAACIRHIITSYDSWKGFFRRLRFTFAPDEIFFQTLIKNSSFGSKVVNDNLRLILWDNMGNGPLELDEKNWWHVTVSSAFFMRKINPVRSDKLLSMTDRYLLPESKVRIGLNGSWSHTSFNGHAFDLSLARFIGKICEMLFIRTVYDFGCGVGWYVRYLRDRGLDVQGYDGNENVREISSLFFNNGFYCQRIDLSKPVMSDEKADMVMSLEVGEHIPPEEEGVFIDNIVTNAEKYVLLSWAIPGQNGDGHINCRENGYIVSELKKRGFRLNVPVSILLRKNASLPWMTKTLMFFENEKE